jgi:hypothetical protein
MKTEHPITPPPELVQQWWDGIHGALYEFEAVATQAPRWGADQELEACCEWLRESLATPSLVECFLAARRPKQPSLKEQALAELDLLKGDANAYGLGFDAPAIRRALEALPDV